MACLAKFARFSGSIINVTKLFSKLSCQNAVSSFVPKSQIVPTIYRSALIHTSLRRNDLMEFFDIDVNWKKNRIQVGRSWKLDELRIKSNEDLHKLWYVLLKEKNMLLTMEHLCNEEYQLFPNPERLDKVEESMTNLETVVRERNEAYYMLETGHTGEQQSVFVKNILGMNQYHRLKQYLIPKAFNSTWRKKHLYGYNGYAVRRFLRNYREKLWADTRKRNNQEVATAIKTLQDFPNTDLEALKKKFPHADMKKVLSSKKFKHFPLASLRPLSQ